MRKLLFVMFFSGVVSVANSQNLTVEGTAPNLYISHTVASKENFYSVGRLYNQAPKLIASFNNVTLEKGLTIGQRIKIPLTAQNLVATGSENASGTLIPLTHIVDKSETLFKIGNTFNASVEQLRKWNNLSSDNITPGKPLIVGNLTMSTNQPMPATVNVAEQSPIISGISAPGRAENNAKEKVVTTTNKEEQAISPATNIATEKKETAVVTPLVKGSESIAAKPVKTETFASVDPSVQLDKTKVADVAKVQSTVQTDTLISIAKEIPVSKAETPASSGSKKSSIDLSNTSEGAFAGNFSGDASSSSIKSKSGEAATFKSTSGWQDKKYYVLMNDVTPGTILKISAAENKFVYAKVLGSMPDMKENNGLLVRISNAAASHLGIIDPKFPVEISYYQ